MKLNKDELGVLVEAVKLLEQMVVSPFFADEEGGLTVDDLIIIKQLKIKLQKEASR